MPITTSAMAMLSDEKMRIPCIAIWVRRQESNISLPFSHVLRIHVPESAFRASMMKTRTTAGIELNISKGETSVRKEVSRLGPLEKPLNFANMERGPNNRNLAI